MSIAQFTPGATPNGNGKGSDGMEHVDRFIQAVKDHTQIYGEDLGAVRMAYAMVNDAQVRALQEAWRRLSLAEVQMSRLQANEDRLLAWLDEYMHDHALATNPDQDLAGAVIDVFKQQQCAIGLLREALEAQKAKAYRPLPTTAEDETPEPPKRKPGKPGPQKITEADNEQLRQAVIAHMQATARNGWAPTQREWNMDKSHDLPTYRAISMRLGAWSHLIEQAGLRMVHAGMHAGYRPAVDELPGQVATSDEELAAHQEVYMPPAPSHITPAEPVALAAKAPAHTVTRQRTVLNARGEPEKLTTRRYLLSE